MADEQIVVQPVVQYLTVVDNPAAITVSSPGPQGQPGQFAPGDISYTYTQATASAVWTINHNLGFNPVAVVLDSAGTQCEGTISYPTLNQMVITFSSAFTGHAYVV